MSMNKEERSLLLYLESRSVDNYGKLDGQHMSQQDSKIIDNWKQKGLIKFTRIMSEEIIGCNYYCELSDEFWKLAHRERKARSLRMKERTKELMPLTLKKLENDS